MCIDSIAIPILLGATEIASENFFDISLYGDGLVSGDSRDRCPLPVPFVLRAETDVARPSFHPVSAEPPRSAVGEPK